VIGLNANSPLIANSGFNGNTDIAMLSGNNSLNVNQNALVTLTVNFSPNTNTLTSLSNIGIVSTSNLPDPTGGGTHTSIDTTHAGNNPDPDGDGNPNEPGENDPVTFGQQIGVSKNALSTVKLENGDNQTTFVFTVQNLGVVSATNVQLVDNLNNTFPSPITYNVVSLTSSSGLNTNTSYDGGADINLLTGTNTLTVGSIQTVTLVVNFNMNGSSLSSLYNYGIATSSSSNGTIISSDTTNVGNNPDTDDDGNPNEPGDNIPTEFSPVKENPDEPESFNIPQGFSPNGDGVNDVFVIRGISKYPNNKLTILNRWGNVVFEKDNYDNTWDGKSTQGIRFGGDELPDGTYFYLFDLGNGEKPYTGFIYISKTIK
jgi:gliding motility-associated-like protein